MTAALRPPADADPRPPALDRRGLFLWLWRNYLARHWRWLVVAMILMAIEGGRRSDAADGDGGV